MIDTAQDDALQRHGNRATTCGQVQRIAAACQCPKRRTPSRSEQAPRRRKGCPGHARGSGPTGRHRLRHRLATRRRASGRFPAEARPGGSHASGLGTAASRVLPVDGFDGSLRAGRRRTEAAGCQRRWTSTRQRDRGIDRRPNADPPERSPAAVVRPAPSETRRWPCGYGIGSVGDRRPQACCPTHRRIAARADDRIAAPSRCADRRRSPRHRPRSVALFERPPPVMVADDCPTRRNSPGGGWQRARTRMRRSFPDSGPQAKAASTAGRSRSPPFPQPDRDLPMPASPLNRITPPTPAWRSPSARLTTATSRARPTRGARRPSMPCVRRVRRRMRSRAYT